jgi:hypothetical protein
MHSLIVLVPHSDELQGKFLKEGNLREKGEKKQSVDKSQTSLGKYCGVRIKGRI